MQQLKQWIYTLGIRAVSEKNFESAYASAELLRKEFDDRGLASFLHYRAKLRQHSEATYKITKALLGSTRKLISRINKESRKKKELTKRYETFLHYMDRVN